MNNPFFSIIVPVYQSKDFLQKTVNKLQKQTFKNIEIILIDDGSTDGSANICDSLAKNDKRIRVFHKINSGASAARNIGIKAARGKWIIFVDSDDIVSTAMCEAFFYYLKKYTLVDFIALNFASKDKLIKEVISISASLQLQNLQQNINLIQHILYSDYNGMPESFKKNFGNNTVLNSPCGKAYRKDFLLKNNIYFQKNIYYSEDLLFNIQILICEAKGVYLDEAVYFYRDNPKSVTKKIYVPNIVENYANFKKILDNLLNKKKINELKKSIDVYTMRTSLRMLPADVFIPQNSIKKSYSRLKQITSTQEFFKIFNQRTFKKSKNKLDVKSRLKSILLIKRHFFILILWYKILK